METFVRSKLGPFDVIVMTNTGYINISRLCTIFKRKYTDYLELVDTKMLFEETKCHPLLHNDEVYVHPAIALGCALWCKPSLLFFFYEAMNNNKNLGDVKLECTANETPNISNDDLTKPSIISNETLSNSSSISNNTSCEMSNISNNNRQIVRRDMNKMLAILFFLRSDAVGARHAYRAIKGAAADIEREIKSAEQNYGAKLICTLRYDHVDIWEVYKRKYSKNVEHMGDGYFTLKGSGIEDVVKMLKLVHNCAYRSSAIRTTSY